MTMRRGLLEIYDSVGGDIEAAAPVCELSGRCCRFVEYGHRLYITRPEAELLLEEGLPANASIDESGCPFQVGKLCTARDRRPFGCRVYFCDPAYAGKAEELSEHYLGKLKQLHLETGTPWEYASLHAFLEEYAAGVNPPVTNRERIDEIPDQSGR